MPNATKVGQRCGAETSAPVMLPATPMAVNAQRVPRGPALTTMR